VRLSTSVFAGDIAEGGSWACLHLKELAICFLFEESEQDLQPLVFERLSALTRLERLIMWASPTDNAGHGKILEFRLDCGMGKLAGLQQLTFIRFDIQRLQNGIRTDYYYPQLGMDEVAWIIDHWKRLEVIKGHFNRNWLLAYVMAIDLESHGILNDEVTA
jgi:hypothetical protein